MGIDDIDEVGRQFLNALFDMADGDPSRQVSMYKVGESIGMDREEAGKAAELLIGNGLAEIKTLSGGIGISEAAASEKKEIGGETQSPDAVSALPLTPTLDTASRDSIDRVVTNIKHDINALELDFDNIAGLVADIRTIEAQLSSPTSKTAIIRECFVSLKSWADKTDHMQIKDQIKSVLG